MENFQCIVHRTAREVWVLQRGVTGQGQVLQARGKEDELCASRGARCGESEKPGANAGTSRVQTREHTAVREQVRTT